MFGKSIPPPNEINITIICSNWQYHGKRYETSCAWNVVMVLNVLLYCNISLFSLTHLVLSSLFSACSLALLPVSFSRSLVVKLKMLMHILFPQTFWHSWSWPISIMNGTWIDLRLSLTNYVSSQYNMYCKIIQNLVSFGEITLILFSISLSWTSICNSWLYHLQYYLQEKQGTAIESS